MLVTQLITNFQSGEIDPTMRGQKDLDAYKNGAKRLRNVQRRSTGGMERRFGLLDKGGLTGIARLEAFEFAAEQRYVVAFSPGRVDIFDLEGTPLTSITAGVPWDAVSMWEMATSQLGDVMVITHDAFASVVLTRTGAATFTLPAMTFEQSPDGKKVFQPYYKFVDPSVTLTPSGDTGAITLTSSIPIWTADHIGRRIRVYDAEVLITALTSSTVANGTVQGKLKGKLDLDPYKTTKGSTVVEVLHLFHGLSSGVSITLSGSNDCGSIPAANFDGTHVVTVLDEHRYTITLTGVSYHYWEDLDGDGTPTSNPYTAARLSEDGGGPNVEFSVAGTPTRAWTEPSFSPIVGYPSACCFHEGRLWLAGSESQPDGAWGSNSLQPFRFDVGKGYDGDSVQVATGTEDVSRTKHLISNGELLVMNANGECAFLVRDGEPITPSNARIKGQSTTGCSEVQPSVFDGAVLFTQANGLAVYELAYAPSVGRYETVPVSLLAGHLIRTPTAIAASPGLTTRAEPMCYFTNSDGTVAVFHSQRRENIAGWALWELGGGALARSVCAVGPDVFFCVAVRGSYRLYKLDPTACLDGAVLHTAPAPQSNWILDARVRGRTVSLVSELGYHGEVAVPADGTVSLDFAVTQLQAGDAYFPTIETLPPSVQLASGPQTGKVQRIVRTITDFGDDSLAVTVNGCPIDTLDPADPAGAIRPVTSPYPMHHLGCERDPTVIFSQSAPLPNWRVLSVLQEVTA